MENKNIFFKGKKKSTFREYAEALITALLVAFVIRSFVVEAFKIPSGSMIPTLVVGDHIFVNKFAYGLRIPFTKRKLIKFRNPDRGEPIVFIYPLDESKDFIKRVVGLPGDQLKFHGDEVYINGAIVNKDALEIDVQDESQHKLIKVTNFAEDSHVPRRIPEFEDWDQYKFYRETLGESTHLMQLDVDPSLDDLEVTVPDGFLFVMGDNRDNSSDSRKWGFVPLENVKGKALMIWLSIDWNEPFWKLNRWIRWNRFGKIIY